MGTVVFILLDGFRHDYLSEKDTPFLWELSKKGSAIVSKTREPFGFQSRPAYLAGLYPEESGVCTLFKYSPETSPFKGTGPLSRLEGLPRVRLWIRKRVELNTSRLAGPIYRYLHTTAQVPLTLLPFFDYSEKELPWEMSLVTPTIFDLIKKTGGESIYVGWPEYSSQYTDETVVSRLCESLSVKHRFAFVQLGLLDGVGHTHGPDSVEIKKALKETDSRVGELYSTFEKISGSFVLFIFGDHGMVKVKEHLPIWSKLRTLQCKLGRDYLVFLDSTTARFWFFDENSKEPIESLLKEVGGGKLLDDADRKTHHIRFNNREYGDLIFLAHSGNLIHPCFFGVGSDAPRGMHGYDPDCTENQGIFILVPDGFKKLSTPEVVDLVDIYATTVSFLGFEVDEMAHGKNLLADKF